MLRKKSVILFVVCILILTGCSNNKKNAENFKPKDKAPEPLTKLVGSLDDILKSLGDIEKLSYDIPLSEEDLKEQQKKAQQQQGQGEQQQQGQGGQSQSGGSSGSSGGSGSSQGSGENPQGSKDKQNQQMQKTNEEKAIDLWKEMELKLQEAHKNWNDYEAVALEKGATKEAGDSFESVFNKFTTSIEAKDLVGGYDYGSQSYAKLKPFYDLYLDDIGGDISILKYATYQSYTRAIMGNIPGASEILSGREENVNRIRMKVEDDEEKKNAIEKIALALTDFKEALNEDSRRLFMIKKDIIIDNLKDIQK